MKLLILATVAMAALVQSKISTGRQPTLVRAYRGRGLRSQSLESGVYHLVPYVPPVVNIRVDVRRGIIIGEPIELTVTVRNIDDTSHSARYSLQLDSILYTRTFMSTIMKKEFTVSLEAGETYSHVVVVPFHDYRLKLAPQMHLQVTTRLHLLGSDYHYKEEDFFHLHYPRVSIELLNTPVRGEPLSLQVSFKNSLPISLTNCSLMITRDGVTPLTRIKLPSVEMDETITTEVTITYDSSSVLFAIINCRELSGIDGGIQLRSNGR